MKYWLYAVVLSLLPTFISWAAPASDSASSVAPYLLPGAPTFDLSITQFRKKFNTHNPDLYLDEFHAIDSSPDKASLTRAATRINKNLYASAALEHGTLKIKSIQITWLPGANSDAVSDKAQDYMTAFIRTLMPGLSKQQSLQKLSQLLHEGTNKHYFAKSDGAIRYIIADNGKKGLTLAIEPIKLALSEPLSNHE